MIRIISILLIICSLLCCLVSCGHEHHWSNPTCTTPKTCHDCGATEGNVSEHSFGAWEETRMGNCTTVGGEQKRICQNCQYEETQSIPPSHNYIGGICTKCNNPFINIKLPGRTTDYRVTKKHRNDITVTGVTWNSIVATESPNTYRCNIRISMYQHDLRSSVYETDSVLLKYVITNSSGSIIFEKVSSFTLSGSRTSYFDCEMHVILDPNESYELSIKTRW